MPEIGAEQHAVEMSVWLAQPGDAVMVGDRVAEVLINGVTFDITTDSSGSIAKIDAVPGDIVRPGMTLGWIEVLTGEQL